MSAANRSGLLAGTSPPGVFCAVGLYFGKLGQPDGRRQIPLPGKFSWELALTDWIADKMAEYLLLTLASALV